MLASVTHQSAVAGESTGVDERNAPPAWRVGRRDNGKVEVHQIAVVATVALSAIDAVRVVADAAWRTQVHDVQSVEREALVTDDALSTVAAVTQGVRFGALGGEVSLLVVTNQQRLKNRSVRTVGAGTAERAGAVAVVTVRTGDDAAGAKGGNQADDVGISPGSRYRVKRWVGRLKLQSRVRLCDLARLVASWA